jgi:diguanylate cyclase (GGDEF)-like protein
VEYYINAPEIWQAKISFEKPISIENLTESNPLQTIKTLLSSLGDSLNQGEFYQRIEQALTIDRITQVTNRGRFESRLTEEWQQMRRNKAPIALILCAFDGLAAYQEVYGIQATERCLFDIAQVIRSCAKRPSDMVARYQDYMFAVLLPDTPEVGVQSVLESIQTQVRALAYLAPDSKPAVTLRLGTASMTPSSEQEAHSLIQMAARTIA